MTALACPDGTFTCRTCSQAKPCSDYYPADSPRGHRLQCADCTRARRTTQRHTPTPGTQTRCAWCGTPFVPTHDRKTYCSYPCSHAAHKSPDASRIYFFTCLHCQRTYTAQRNGRKYCSKECSWRYGYPDTLVKPRPATCATCGTTYTQRHAARTRCEPCTAQHHDAMRAAHKARRRSRERSNGPWESISRQAIYERDNWTCYLCGTPVDRAAAATDDKAPTLDHVMPLALGGTHTADNLRLACRACNIAKGARFLVAPPAADRPRRCRARP